MTSQEMSIDIGGYLLSKTEGKIPVELRNPETKIKCELREHNVVATVILCLVMVVFQ